MEQSLVCAQQVSHQVQQQQLVADFSDLFRQETRVGRPSSKKDQKKWILTIPSIGVTTEQLMEKKVLDIRRWVCMSRPQYPRSCGVSSLVSVWNYLYSTLGTDSLEPLSTEKALLLLGIAKEGEDLGHGTPPWWFMRLCILFGVKGDASMALKLSGKNATNITPQQGLQSLKMGLKSERSGYIYHSENHYFCPIGYQVTPDSPLEAYQPLDKSSPKSSQTWIIIGQPSKSYAPFHVLKWQQLVLDLSTKWPYYYNIRNMSKGIQRRQSCTQQNQCQQRGTMHCIMEFRKQ